MSDFVTATWALIVGLWWLWAFLGCVAIASLAISGGIGLLIFIDVQVERWHRRRGHVRVLDLVTGRERWAPVPPAAQAALERTAAEIRSLSEVRRG